ncbi:MAG: hypothetical protein ABIX12_05215 [Rubrivivax sp.]
MTATRMVLVVHAAQHMVARGGRRGAQVTGIVGQLQRVLVVFARRVELTPEQQAARCHARGLHAGAEPVVVARQLQCGSAIDSASSKRSSPYCRCAQFARTTAPRNVLDRGEIA